MPTTHFRGTRDDIRRITLDLANVLAGRGQDTQGVRRAFMTALGFAALSDIKEAFLTKAQGGTDEMGIKWPPLSPKTIANRRVGPGDIRTKSRPGETKGAELTRIQKALLIQKRERIRKRETKKALTRFRLSLPEAEAQRRAKIVGGLKATRETGKTKVQTLGGRQVEMLRDTGVLLNSLSPGTLSGETYSKPGGEGGEEQIFEITDSEVIVGTNVLYASTHQNGDPGRNIPARPFLPNDDHPVPDVWWQRWIDVANKALAAAAAQLYARGGQ